MNYRFTFSDYEVANLHLALEVFLDYVDEYRYDISGVQRCTVEFLIDEFEGIASKYHGITLQEFKSESVKEER